MRHARSLSFALVGAVLLALSATPLSATAAATSVSTFAQLQAAAVTTAADGDVITLSNDIVMTSALTISKGITIDGAGFTLSVSTPGVTEAGLNAASPSTHGLFSITSTTLVTLQNVTLMGGNSASSAINVASGAKLTMTDARVERSRNSGGGGGGIYNAGQLTMVDSYLRRNSANYGGGIINASSGLLIMERSSLTENRTESSNGGGGGVENQGTMWLSNTTFANNMTTAGGGAINNYGGKLYVSHSTFVGNVSTGPYDGGAILSFNRGGSTGIANVVSSLFAYNYSKNAASTAFVLDDFASSAVTSPLSVAANVTVAYSLVHTADSWPSAINDSNITDYTAAIDGSDDTLFSGGTYAYPTNGSGAVVTSYGMVFRPNLFVQSGLPTGALVSLAVPGMTGAPVEFTPTTAFGYYSSSSSAWVYAVGAGTDTQNQTTDQIGVARSATAPTVGSLEGTVPPTFLVSSPVATGGSVSGASAYGDPYPAGATVTITAVPDNGYTFTEWSVVVGAAASTTPTANPLVFTVADTTVVTPVFAVAGAGVRTVTYTAFGADSGTPPAAVTGSASVTIDSTGGTLARAGFALIAWNTSSNGSGTAYAFAQSYSGASNLTLYPVWSAVTSYPVTYDSQGGSTVAAGSFVSGGSIAAPPAAPTRSGFTFDGWAATSGGAALTFPYSPGTASGVTLFARWSAVASSGSTSSSSSTARTLPDTGLHLEQPLALGAVLLLVGVALVFLGTRARQRRA